MWILPNIDTVLKERPELLEIKFSEGKKSLIHFQNLAIICLKSRYYNISWSSMRAFKTSLVIFILSLGVFQVDSTFQFSDTSDKTFKCYNANQSSHFDLSYLIVLHVMVLIAS